MRDGLEKGPEYTYFIGGVCALQMKVTVGFSCQREDYTLLAHIPVKLDLVQYYRLSLSRVCRFSYIPAAESIGIRADQLHEADRHNSCRIIATASSIEPRSRTNTAKSFPKCSPSWSRLPRSGEIGTKTYRFDITYRLVLEKRIHDNLDNGRGRKACHGLEGFVTATPPQKRLHHFGFGDPYS
ncbi:hypothetical protein B0J17DRAFT_635267 [Rhizoctonia solani]|nr:hypothetical protein B0J17DRAFT_635267 [Rhizoctonia solani]